MTALIRLRQVRKAFAQGERSIEVLRGVDLEIEEGEFVAVAGRSGSGKTTCLEIMGALSRPTSGSYHFDGAAVHELDEPALCGLRARRIGFVFQTFNLMSRMNALRNVGLPLVYAGVGRRERDTAARALLERVGLGHRLEHRPAELSGGERQRVAIARALVNDPRVLLGDEPTGNLDQATSNEILAMLEDLHREGRTLVLVTHSDDVARRAQRVVHLLDGCVVREERHAHG